MKEVIRKRMGRGWKMMEGTAEEKDDGKGSDRQRNNRRGKE